MSESTRPNQSLALPTVLAATMLAGIVAIAWEVNISAPSPARVAAQVTTQAAPAAPAPTVLAARLPGGTVPATTVAGAPAPEADASLVAEAARPAIAASPAPTAFHPTFAAGQPARAVAPPMRAAADVRSRLANPPTAPITGPAQDARLASSKPVAVMPAVRPTRAADGNGPGGRIAVRPGQTLWQIARAEYGQGSDAWAIYRANRSHLARAGLVRAGQVLRLPVLSHRTGTNTAVTVQPGQSLWHIARRAYGTGDAYRALYRANRQRIAAPSMIRPGEVLVLPTRVIAVD